MREAAQQGEEADETRPGWSFVAYSLCCSDAYLLRQPTVQTVKAV